MSERTVIATDGAPRPYAGAPYNQAIRAAGLVFCAGQVGLDPASGTLVPGGVAGPDAAGDGEPARRCSRRRARRSTRS